MVFLFLVFFKQDSFILPENFILNSDKMLIEKSISDLIIVNLTQNSIIIIDSNLQLKKNVSLNINKFSEMSDFKLINNQQILYSNKFDPNIYILNKFFDRTGQINLSTFLTQIDQILFFNNSLYIYDNRLQKIFKFNYPQMDLKLILEKSNYPELNWINLSQITLWNDSWAIVEDSYLHLFNKFDLNLSSFYLDEDVKIVSQYKSQLLYLKSNQTIEINGKVYTDILTISCENHLYLLNKKVLQKIEIH